MNRETARRAWRNVTLKGALLALAAMQAACSGTTSAAAGQPAQQGEALAGAAAVGYAVWHDPTRARDVPVKIFAPEPDGGPVRRPVVLFSHGFGESRDAFDYLGRALAEAGYIGIFVTHIGSDREAQQTRGLPRGDTATHFDPRPLDLRFVMDLLESGDTGSSLIGDTADVARIAVAGQCAGSTTALYLAGLTLETGNGSLRYEPDPRVRAVVALGPQMPIRTFAPRYWQSSNAFEGGSSDLHERSWERITLPALVVTGSEDFNYFPAVQRDPSLIRMAYDGMPPGDHYLANVIGAEHHAFTGSEPWYPAGPRDPRHHPLIARLTVQFLDAFLKDDADALAALRGKSIAAESGGLVVQEDKTGPDAAPARPRAPVATDRPEPGEQQFRDLFRRLDTDRDGYLGRREVPDSMPRLSRGFDAIDADRDGRLSEREFVGTLSRAGTSRPGAGIRPGGPGPAQQTTPGLPAARYGVRDETLVWITDSGRGRQIPLRVTYPDAPGPFPLVLLSHFAGGTKDAYEGMLRYWAGQGYICVAPDHADSAAPARRGGQSPEEVADRTADLTAVLDDLPGLVARVPGLAGRIDAERIGVAGHYLGAMSASLLAGLRWEPRPGAGSSDYRDARVDAVVVISPVGTGQGLNEDSWKDITIPMMTITGSRDVSARTGKDAQWRTEGFRFSPSGDKYLVYIEGYMSKGNPATPGRTPFQEAVGAASAAQVYVASATFWDAYLRSDAGALKALRDNAVFGAGDSTVTITSR